MRRFFAVFLFILFAPLIAGGPAAAQSRRDWNTCFNGTNLDARLAACSKVIARAGQQVPAKSRSIAYNSRGYVHNERKQYDLAIRDFDKSLGLDATNAFAFNNRGAAFTGKGEFDRAIRDHDEAIRLDPRNVAFRLNRIFAYVRKGENELAIRDCDEALRLDPTNALAFTFRGFAYSSKGDADRAIRDLDEAIRLDPENTTILNNRGGVFVLRGEYDHAIREYDRALRIDSTNAAILTNRGFAFSHKGDFDRAIRDFDEAIRLNPRFPNVYSVRGESFRRKGDLDRALADLGECLRLDPTMAPAYTSRGLVFEAKGDITRARNDFKAALAAPDTYYLDRDWAIATARAHLAAIEAGAPADGPRPAKVATAAPETPAAAAGPKATPPVQPAPAAVATPSVGSGTRVALVIGNGAYRHATRLANPTNDAADIARSLRKLGFEVVEGLDLGKHEMEAKLRAFGERLDRAGLALFFYAGHGLQVADRNYLVPVDAKLTRPGDLALDTVTVDDVLAQMESARRVNLVFLDACRDNPLARTLAASLGARSAAVGTGLAPIQSAVGTMIVYATQPKNVALDGDGRNSPFMAALLKHIATPGLEIAALMKRVRADVWQETHERQLPWDHSSLIGDVVLAR